MAARVSGHTPKPPSVSRCSYCGCPILASVLEEHELLCSIYPDSEGEGDLAPSYLSETISDEPFKAVPPTQFTPVKESEKPKLRVIYETTTSTTVAGAPKPAATTTAGEQEEEPFRTHFSTNINALPIEVDNSSVPSSSISTPRELVHRQSSSRRSSLANAMNSLVPRLVHPPARRTDWGAPPTVIIINTANHPSIDSTSVDGTPEATVITVVTRSVSPGPRLRTHTSPPIEAHREEEEDDTKPSLKLRIPITKTVSPGAQGALLKEPKVEPTPSKEPVQVKSYADLFNQFNTRRGRLERFFELKQSLTATHEDVSVAEDKGPRLMELRASTPKRGPSFTGQRSQLVGSATGSASGVLFVTKAKPLLHFDTHNARQRPPSPVASAAPQPSKSVPTDRRYQSAPRLGDLYERSIDRKQGGPNSSLVRMHNAPIMAGERLTRPNPSPLRVTPQASPLARQVAAVETQTISRSVRGSFRRGSVSDLLSVSTQTGVPFAITRPASPFRAAIFNSGRLPSVTNTRSLATDRKQGSAAQVSVPPASDALVTNRRSPHLVPGVPRYASPTRSFLAASEVTVMRGPSRSASPLVRRPSPFYGGRAPSPTGRQPSPRGVPIPPQHVQQLPRIHSTLGLLGKIISKAPSATNSFRR